MHSFPPLKNAGQFKNGFYLTGLFSVLIWGWKTYGGNIGDQMWANFGIKFTEWWGEITQ
jgi:hypothetical protein